ncbi:nucleotidyltransferase [Vagococcus xieshaowenii]|uniref:tRNA(Met) cytidine acetate ligase n=1 Tax=Vagococcus xieshaowenii TaxID=2562451 RepID=A0AAJ5EDQ8_9ENTE|nr:nucleotidyltransferase [Vagococcus xieshaowenii]QCA28652.1 nucleotidyltransferase [Vagococcus xieshaowenii]TFZ40541.1 nucleotidyltransferase [Vagococcus xieshaowenii]
MKSCGIIAEYNPFHNGHEYQIKQARQYSKAEAIIVVMSGNFLQRGEPAIIDKWQRAALALEYGADLVVELPFAYAVQAADYFAEGGIKLLHALGVEALSFGTDYEGLMDYHAFAQFQLENESAINRAFKAIQNNGMSYPQQMTDVYRQLFPEMCLDFSSPNHILGMSYAKENIKYTKPMTLIPITRYQSSHNDTSINEQSFASGTAIRKLTLDGELSGIKHVLPNNTYDILRTETLVSWENLWPLLKYQLTVLSTDQLARLYQVTQGIEYRLKEAVRQATSFAEFVSQVKTKRFTWTRIQRLCTYLLLNVNEEEITEARKQPYVRILGFNDVGQQLIKERKKSCEIPIITNINKKNESLLRLDIRAGQIYQMAKNDRKEQDYYQSPIRKQQINTF